VAEPALRAYAPSDRAAVVGLIRALNIHENAVSGDRREDEGGASEHLDRLLPELARAGGELLLAEAGGRVLGLIAWRPQDDDAYVVAPLSRFAMISELVVESSARRQGIGRALLAEVERRARAAGLPRLMVGLLVGNAEAEALYAAAGFRPYALRLEKPLSPG
jgi:GNAT superfamily N-acetyltransferase